MLKSSPLLDLVCKAFMEIANDAAQLLSTFRFSDYVAILAGFLVLRGIYMFLRLWRSDCDLQLSDAVRKQPKKSMQGKVILITGASSGIGQALAYEYAAHGAILILSARRMDRLMDTIDHCLEHGAEKAEAIRLDITDIESHERVLAPIIKKYGRIHVLVNNAGRSQRALVEETSIEVDKEMFHVSPPPLSSLALPLGFQLFSPTHGCSFFGVAECHWNHVYFKNPITSFFGSRRRTLREYLLSRWESRLPCQRNLFCYKACSPRFF